MDRGRREDVAPKRNFDTPESRAFWIAVVEDAKVVATWPDWKKAGISSKRTLGDD